VESAVEQRRRGDGHERFFQNVHQVGPGIQAPARQHFVQDNARCVEVGGRADGGAGQLFRRHVLKGADDATHFGIAGVGQSRGVRIDGIGPGGDEVSPSYWRATPKSAILAVPDSSRKMLAGLTSR